MLEELVFRTNIRYMVKNQFLTGQVSAKACSLCQERMNAPLTGMVPAALNLYVDKSIIQYKQLSIAIQVEKREN